MVDPIAVEEYLQKKGFNKKLVDKIKTMRDQRKTRVFTAEQIQNSLIIHSVSPKAYEILRNNNLTYYTLPHKSTLYRRVSHFQCYPGVQTEFFQYLKLQLSVEDFWYRQCIIMFDEMDLCEKYEYSDHLKCLFKKHKKVQVVLLR